MQNIELRFIADFLNQIKLVLKRREKGITALDFMFHERQVKVGAARQCLRVNFRAAADENVIGKLVGIQFVQRVENQNFRLHFSPSFVK